MNSLPQSSAFSAAVSRAWSQTSSLPVTTASRSRSTIATAWFDKMRKRGLGPSSVSPLICGVLGVEL